MKSLLFRTASDYLLPLLLLFSLFMLLRGHYEPGGGFVGGLMASIAFLIHSFAHGLKETRNIIRINPMTLMPIGLMLTFLAGIAPWFINEPFLTGLWYPEPMRFIGMLGSALVFDIGVYLVVIGATLTIMFSITETV
ncbi:multicomponent Na+:H+ antiporter subunit B [Aquiflexum balticum DSM 16537]|uniref:Multicomponent Na+:H+ antiporter subunit B n=1 Tax=Aquiflexum balticum DSM 16537 TaxID=758820 RepID=A0A1W2H7N3_9BACT|nr:Na+/H+ antiporter subunit B [Aquiflexum balticum]SMD44937.1 multicomponent Na+:H+ antiporter subunit B [Aquiflexum balticum DSM 16537]